MGLDYTQFKDRLYSGMHGEDTWSEACRRRVITNLGHGEGPKVTETEWSAKEAQIKANTVDGDKWMILPSGQKICVDVKNSLWIAEKCLHEFRLDGYYFCNAFVWDPDCGYFLVKADAFYREWAMENGKMVVLNGKRGYFVPSFYEMPVSLFNNANGYFPDMDPKLYRKLVAEKYEEFDKLNIPYKKRIL